MRLPLLISLLVHIGIIVAGIIVIPRTEEFKIKKTEAVPVEVIKLSDITRNKAKKKPKQLPKKPPPKKAEPKKVEAKKPAPKPKAKLKPKPKKEVKKKPQKPVKKKPKFNADRISALLDKTPDKKVDNSLEALENRVTQDERDALRAQVERCWSPPPGAANDETGAVAKLQIWLKPDGSLQRDPKVLNSGSGVYFKALSDSAIRAVRRCQPFKMPLEKYNSWKEVILNFDPSEMFRN